jgi:hypothetical protein
MAKKNEIYAPGELDRVRQKLGDLDAAEAKRMAGILGGEVGTERSESPPPRPRPRNDTVNVHVRGKSGRAGVQRSYGNGAEPETEKVHVKPPDPMDDPSKPIRLSYWERVKMDRLMGQTDFDIKSPAQVLRSLFSFFGTIPDMVSASFVNKRMNGYYSRIESMVSATRTLLPRNNLMRNERFKRLSPPAYSILDIIRTWNIELIADELTKIQTHPRNVRVIEFGNILRCIYKPLFLLERLDTEQHIKEAFKLLYKVIFLEDFGESKDQIQERIRIALAAFGYVRRDIQYLLYPMLVKILSDRFFPYTVFFRERRRRFMAFLEVTEESRLEPRALLTSPDDFKKLVEEDKKKETGKEEGAEEEASLSEEEKEKRAASEAERKALDRGLDSLEILFPKAGWDDIQNYPDMYPYFANIFNMRRGWGLMAPTDPLLQIAVLMYILEELFYGLRYVNFGTVSIGGVSEHIGDAMASIMTNWHSYIDVGFKKAYLPRLDEYCRILDNPSDSKNSSYAKRLHDELHWTKRLYFLPYYRFESNFPPPANQKTDIIPIFTEARHLRRYLTAVAAEIDQSNRQGGAKTNAHCDGIDNPWAPYSFEVPNPLSVRLDALMGKKKTNASLVFFTLAAAMVLDHLMNNENSWAYSSDRPLVLFRSVDGQGIAPQFGVDELIDADAIFKQSLKSRGDADPTASG